MREISRTYEKQKQRKDHLNRNRRRDSQQTAGYIFEYEGFGQVDWNVMMTIELMMMMDDDQRKEYGGCAHP